MKRIAMIVSVAVLAATAAHADIPVPVCQPSLLERIPFLKYACTADVDDREGSSGSEAGTRSSLLEVEAPDLRAVPVPIVEQKDADEVDRSEAYPLRPQRVVP